MRTCRHFGQSLVRTTAVFALGLALSGTGPAMAGGVGAAPADPVVASPAPAPADAWRFTVMPYVWGTGVSGSIRPIAGAPTLSFDRSLADTLESLDSAFFLSFAAERGRLVILGDVSSVKSSAEGTLPGGIPAEGRLTQRTLTLAGGYRVHADARSAVDVFGGFRAYEVSADIVAAGGAVTASPTRSFVDPIIGARALFALSPRWSTMLYADVGGFGVGNESAVVLSALLNYSISESIAISGGYRAMWIDYDDRGTIADVSLGGPVLGVSFRF